MGGEGKKINQYLLGISEIDWNAITAPIPREYKIYEVILELISSAIKLPYEDKNGLQQWIKCSVANTKKTKIKWISFLQQKYTPLWALLFKTIWHLCSYKTCSLYIGVYIINMSPI